MLLVTPAAACISRLWGPGLPVVPTAADQQHQHVAEACRRVLSILAWQALPHTSTCTTNRQCPGHHTGWVCFSRLQLVLCSSSVKWLTAAANLCLWRLTSRWRI